MFCGCLYFMRVYCMLRYKSNKIHRYSVNTYYVQSTVLGANQYTFYPKPCQWLAVWFRASLLILVCLIPPTCKVGITILSTYLPRRGVVRIHGLPFGALNLLEEVWHKHNLLFFIVLHAFEDLRAKESHIQAAATTVPWKSRADETHKGTVRTLSSFPLWSCLNWNLWLKEPWKYFLQVINSYKWSLLMCICRTGSLPLLNAPGMCPLLIPEC